MVASREEGRRGKAESRGEKEVVKLAGAKD
jgi:hypothetical protein